MKLILATGNKGKVSEIRELLEDLDIVVLSKDELGIDINTIEDQLTLEGNAKKKAEDIHSVCNEFVVADDTGLFVESLNNEPGIYSARYAGEHSSDKDNRIKLLEKLKNIENRNAYFMTCMALIDNTGRLYYAKGICYGTIAHKECGKSGFGYDSVFIPEGYDITFAQMTTQQKNSISHRRKALDNLKSILGEIIDENCSN